VAHLHAVGEAEPGHGPLQEVHPAALGVEEQPAPARAFQGDGEGGEAAAGTQVDGGARTVAEGPAERAGVGQVRPQVAGADPAEALGLGQEVGELAQSRVISRA
jgi:hypothetical protein